MLNYSLTQRAVRDLESARDWYDRHTIELGDRFIQDVLETLIKIRERAASFPLVHRQVRAASCRRFPYRLYFESLTDEIVVLAVYHTARDPMRWSSPDRQ